jgi:hypothetical protein
MADFHFSKQGSAIASMADTALQPGKNSEFTYDKPCVGTN